MERACALSCIEVGRTAQVSNTMNVGYRVEVPVSLSLNYIAVFVNHFILLRFSPPTSAS